MTNNPCVADAGSSEHALVFARGQAFFFSRGGSGVKACFSASELGKELCGCARRSPVPSLSLWPTAAPRDRTRKLQPLLLQPNQLQ